MEAVESVWVTGASGMLGKTLLKMLQGHGAMGISRRDTPGGVRCDLADPFQVKRLFKSARPSLVVNCAAYSDVDGCERDPKAAYDSNILATKFLSEACAKHRIPWIYISTDYVFDGRKNSPYMEEDAAAPVNIYGLTKWAGEHYAKSCDVSSVVVRTSWLFGHGGNPHNFVSAVMGRFKKEKKIRVLDDQTDCPTNMKDLSEALLKIGSYLMNEQGAGRAWHDVFHVCNAGGTTRYEMTLHMKEWLGLKDLEVERADASEIKNRSAVRPAYAVMSAGHYESFFHAILSCRHPGLGSDHAPACGKMARARRHRGGFLLRGRPVFHARHGK